MKSRHIPLRLCTGCYEMKPKNELIRITQMKCDPKMLFIDMKGKAPGKGAYVCKNIDCVKNLKKSHKIERIFSQRVPEAFYAELEEVASSDE